MKHCLIFFSIWIVSCSHPESREEYLKKRGIQYIKVGDVEMMTNLLNKSPKKTDSVYSNSEYIYFDVTISKLSGEKFGKDKTMYLDFDMQKDFAAVVKNDTLQASFCQKIENGKAGTYEYIMAFEKPANIDGVTLLYDDKIFGVGKVAFAYQASDLKNTEPKS